MCLVNCVKNIDLLNPKMISDSQIMSELIRAEGTSNAVLETEIKPDFITVGTQWTRRAIKRMNRRWIRLQKSPFVRILTKTSQPIHVAAVILTCLAMYTLYPMNQSQQQQQHPATSPQIFNSCPAAVESLTSPQIQPIAEQSPNTNKFALFGYLSTFAIQFGAQMWMTFVSGLALYFSLPRHTFGQCQRVLFPKYFAMNGSLGLLKLFSFCQLLETRERIGTAAFVQIVLMGLTTLIEAGIYLHLVTPLLNLMHLKHKYEMMVGSGQEVGFENLKQLKASPEYQRVHKNFRRTHMAIAMGNLITVASSFGHLYYMIQNIEMK